MRRKRAVNKHQHGDSELEHNNPRSARALPLALHLHAGALGGTAVAVGLAVVANTPGTSQRHTLPCLGVRTRLHWVRGLGQRVQALFL